MKTQTIRCIVAATDGGGEPSLFPVFVECTEDQYHDGLHYVAAREAAEDAGYEAYLVLDENDHADLMDATDKHGGPLFWWGEAPIVRADP